MRVDTGPIPKLPKSRDHDKDGYPKACLNCGRPVLLRQAAQMHRDHLTGEAWSRHLDAGDCQ